MLRAGTPLALVLVGLAGIVAAQDQPRPAVGPSRVTIEAEHEPLLGVIKKLCGQYGLNYVASEGALEKAGKVSLRLVDVPLDAALDTICEVYGLEARLRGTILVVRLRDVGGPPARAPERTAGNRFVPDEPAPPAPPPAERPAERPPERPADGVAVREPSRAPRLLRAEPAAGGASIVGTVVEITSESLTLKEATGSPRTFFATSASDERTSRLTLALRHLKRGERVALEWRSEEGRPVILNLVGGGNPNPSAR